MHLDIALFQRLAAAQEPLQERLGLDLRRLELGQEYTRQIAHGGGVAEIILHEDFDTAPGGGVLVAHALRHLDLHVKGELVIGPPDDQMQMTAHRPEEIFGLGKGGKFLGGEHAQGHEFAHITDAVQVFGDPEQRLQVSQAALALFDVGLDHIALALLFVPRVAFRQLGLGKGALGALEEIVPEALIEFLGQHPLARQKAVFEEGGADRVILCAQAQTVADGAAGMAHLEPQIPEHVEHGFNHALGPGGDLVGREKQQVYIGMRGHFATAITAHGKDGDALGFGRVGQRVHDAGGHVERGQDHAIGQPAIGAGGGARGKRLSRQTLGNRGAALGDAGVEAGHDPTAESAHVRPGLGHGLRDLCRDGGNIENRLGGTDQIVPHRDGLDHVRRFTPVSEHV